MLSLVKVLREILAELKKIVTNTTPATPEPAAAAGDSKKTASK